MFADESFDHAPRHVQSTVFQRPRVAQTALIFLLMLSQKKPKFPEGKTNEGTAQLSDTICKNVATNQKCRNAGIWRCLREPQKEGRNHKCKLFQRWHEEDVISRSVVQLTQAVAQCAINCTLRRKAMQCESFRAEIRFGQDRKELWESMSLARIGAVCRWPR